MCDQFLRSQSSGRKLIYPVETGIRREEIYSTSCLLAKTLGFEPQPNKAIVGRNAFAHEAGMHQHGILNNPLCYEIMTPESVGVPPNRIVLGKHSGRNALAHKLREMGHELSAETINHVYDEFVRLADSKKQIYDQDLLSILIALRAKMPVSTKVSGTQPSTGMA
jgi:2-isopropylmalate synthase